MAMNRNLEAGTVLFTYNEAEYGYQNHRYGRPKYTIRFKVLYVHNRRERTAGAYVPNTLISTLDKLGIRHTSEIKNRICAVGCRNITYHQVQSDSPYPTADQIQAAQQKLEAKLAEHELRNEGIGLFELDFIETFKEKKMSNKDALFVINKPLEEFINNEYYIS